MTQSLDAVLSAQSAAFAERLYPALHHLYHEVSIDSSTTAQDIVLSCCCHDHRRRYELHVAVVMPDHVHLILTPLIDEQRQEIFSLMKIVQTIKGASARAINQQLRRSGAVWQEESFDHVLRSSEGLDAKVDYVLQNPVRKGLVKNWHEYRWSWQREDRAAAKMTVKLSQSM